MVDGGSRFLWDVGFVWLHIPHGSKICIHHQDNISSHTGLSGHSWALCKNESRKYKNETIIPMTSILCYIFTARWMPLVTQTIQCVLCWIQHIGQILVYSEFNIRHLIKHWRTNSSSKIKIHNMEITVKRAQHTRFIQNTMWYIFSSQGNDLWTAKYNSVLAWTSAITKSYLPLKIPPKPEEFKVTVCVAVVTPSGIAHTLHSNGNIMQQNSKHPPWSTK